MSLEALDRYKVMIDRFLERVPRGFECEPVLADAAAYALEGGKRLRGSILLSFFETLGGSAEDALGFAAALEMIHAYSLAHDDLPCMDDDDFRRGKPSCHKQFGYATALLAGDALLTAAFEVASTSLRTAGPSPSPGDGELPAPKGITLHCERIVRAIAILSRAAGPSGMVGGQVLDLALEGKSAGAERVRDMYYLKTGALFGAAARLGAMLAGASPEAEEAAGRWGSLFGFAYQVLDDIEDLEQSDKEEDKDTLARETSLAAARLEARKALELALSSLRHEFGGRPSPVLALTERYLEETL